MQKPNSKTQSSAPSSSFGAQDVIYVVFKHKWMILILTLVGLGTAAVIYKQQVPLYKSESKLLIRYVMAKGTIDPYEAVSAPGGGMRGKSDPVLNTEIEILYSRDLCTEVAAEVGKEKLLPEAGPDVPLDAAAGAVLGGLEVLPGYSPSVLWVNYKNKDPELSKEVLKTLLDCYFKRHLEIHRSVEAFDLVAREAAEAKDRLREKELELNALCKETGVMSLADATAALTAQKSKTQEDLLKARADRAEKLAALRELEKNSEAAAEEARQGELAKQSNAPAGRTASSAVISEHRSLVELIGFLQKRELELRIKFKPGNQLLLLNRRQLDTNEARRRDLERQYPDLVAQEHTPAADAASPRAKWIFEKAGLAALDAKIDVLNAHLKEIGDQFSREYSVGSKVEQLTREKEMLETEYRTMEAKLKTARVETTLDPSHMPNIKTFQEPTEPVKTVDEKMQKIILGIAGSGLGLGLGLAFLIELFFNRKISRPIEIQTRMQLPLLLTIPYLGGKTRGRFMLPGVADLPLIGGEGNDNLEIAIESRRGASGLARSEHFILPYAETLRDRIIFNFEVNNVLHKPKFVAVAGLSEGAGASTIAAGLAKSFSEINGAKVLLVDLSSLHPEESPVFGEMPLHSINGALELTTRGDFRQTEENLYYASAVARRSETGITSFSPIHLYELMPKLQESGYDYIVFDMPKVDETSRTLAMAGFMDKMLLVLDAENTSRDALQWGYSELVKGKADVSCIFNKTRNHAPGWLAGN